MKRIKKYTILGVLKEINFLVIGFVLTGVQMSFAKLNQPNDKFGIIPVVVPPWAS